MGAYRGRECWTGLAEDERTMIRVNLLPIKQARRRSQGRAQLLVFAAAIFIQVVALFAFYSIVNDEVEEKRDQVTVLEREKNSIEGEVDGAEQLEAEAEQLREQLRVLTELEARRIGPVRMLDEIQAMLSPPSNEEARVNQLRRDWNVEWDTRRLWIEAFEEGDGTFTLSGFAGNADDVAEFLQRMTTARYFDDVQLDFLERTSQQRGSTRLVQFRIFGQLSYTGFNGRTSGQDGS